jgi:hypothetical protein
VNVLISPKPLRMKNSGTSAMNVGNASPDTNRK